MIVTGGHTDRFGGGIRVGKNVNLRLYMSQIVSNSAGEAGGGIYSDGIVATAVL
jgi:predicted outer membrane repeat protein